MKLKTTPWLVVTLVATAATATLAPRSSSAQENQTTSEYELKAASLYNFTKFIEWPAESFTSPKTPFVIGIAGENPFNGALERSVKDKSYGDHPITVRQVTTPSEFQRCQVLFVTRSERKKIGDIFKAVRRSSVLTVGETDRFLQSGGMINFVTENGKVRFEINHDAAQRAQLKISSKLLGLASRVINPAR